PQHCSYYDRRLSASRSPAGQLKAVLPTAGATLWPHHAGLGCLSGGGDGRTRLIRFAALGSGSRGNALVVEAGSTRVLLDCGFGPMVVEKRLARLGLVPADIDAVVVTHEHSDHIGGVGRCAR